MKELAKVYVVDDDEQMRRLLVRQLGGEYEVIGFATARSFLEVAAALTAGCLVLDVRMPEIDGLEVQRRLAERRLHFPIIMITGLGEVSIAVQAMKAGAIDFVEKPFGRETILAGVRLAFDHLTPVRTADDGASDARKHLARLSPREMQVLSGLVAGLPNKTIAYDLGLSPRTVEMHRASVMRKMEAASLSALVRAAVAAGIQIKP